MIEHIVDGLLLDLTSREGLLIRPFLGVRFLQSVRLAIFVIVSLGAHSIRLGSRSVLLTSI